MRQGKVEKVKGWKRLFSKQEENKEKEGSILPDMNENDSCFVNVEMKEGMTKPPKPYTEDGLIQVLKNAGKEVDDRDAKKALNQLEGIDTGALYAHDFVNTGGHKMDNLIESRNHFELFDFMIDTIDEPITKRLIKEYHQL